MPTCDAQVRRQAGRVLRGVAVPVPERSRRLPRRLRAAAIVEQVQVERFVGLLLVVALALNRDGLRRLAGGEGQRAGLGDVISSLVVAAPSANVRESDNSARSI